MQRESSFPEQEYMIGHVDRFQTTEWELYSCRQGSTLSTL